MGDFQMNSILKDCPAGEISRNPFTCSWWNSPLKREENSWYILQVTEFGSAGMTDT